MLVLILPAILEYFGFIWLLKEDCKIHREVIEMFENCVNIKIAILLFFAYAFRVIVAGSEYLKILSNNIVCHTKRVLFLSFCVFSYLFLFHKQ